MTRPIYCALAALCCFSSVAPSVQGGDYFAPESCTGCDECITSGGDIWGRINPGFAGCPTISFAADLVILGRTAPTSQAILFDGGGVTPILDASDLDESTRAGGRLNLTFYGEGGWDIMFDVLFMDDITARQTVDPSGGVTLFFYQGIAADPVDTATYISDLDTGEINLRRRLSRYFALLGGIRYLELSEELNFGEAATPNSGYFSQSDNRLFGIQFGAEAVLPTDGFGRFFATGKYGIYNNRYEVGAQATSGGSLLDIRIRDDMTAYVGELNAGWEIQALPCMTIRLGYQAFWLENVVLSVDQLNQFDIFSGNGTVAKGSVSYHGFFTGVVFTF